MQLGPSKFENDVHDVMENVVVLNISEPIEDFRELSRRFVVESYVWRKVQKAKEENELVCTDCYTETKQIKFLDVLGIEQHYRRIHYGKKLSRQKSNKLFQELHYTETKTFTDKLLDFRRGNPHSQTATFSFLSDQATRCLCKEARALHGEAVKERVSVSSSTYIFNKQRLQQPLY